ncbi:MAG: glycosyltransferase family 39 protein [Candidatus Daviesbacteria bacterium]|nr:glycosyltransferase family 39 protein [Candidatus Daviesbacteria bacterium]
MRKWILPLILLAATIIRLTTVAKLMPFTPDEEYLSYIAQTLIKDFHIIWIGVSALGFDFYMGPFWIYIIYPFLFLSHGDPLILGYLASALGVGAAYLLYWLGKKLFNEKVGLIASLLYAFSPLLIYYDQKPYPSGIPFLSLLLAISIYMTKYSNKWWLLFAFAYAMVFHIHLSLTLVIFVAFYWGFLHRKLLNKKIILLSLLVFTLTISPLIAFDYFHKMSNITVPLRIIKSLGSHTNKLDFGSRFNIFFESLGRIWYLPPYRESSEEIVYPCTVDFSTSSRPPLILSVLTLILLLYFAINKSISKNEGKKFLLLLSLPFLVPFTILPVIGPVEYYLLGFFPLLLLIMASIVDQFRYPIKYLAYICIIVMVSLSVFTVTHAKGDYGLNVKRDLIQKVIQTIGDQPYDLSEEGVCHKYEGWRYLFAVYGRRPERSSEDTTFAWLYPIEVSTKPAKYSVIMKETGVQVPINQNYKYLLQSGGFSAYIFEHQ